MTGCNGCFSLYVSFLKSLSILSFRIIKSLTCLRRIHRKEKLVGLFKKKEIVQTYDKENKKPVIRSSICTGEQVAGFKDIHTGRMEEVMLIKSPADLEKFRTMFGIEEEITKEY